MWGELTPQLAMRRHAVISGATGVDPATAEEREFLARHAVPVRTTGTYMGHAVEAQFPMNIAIATLALRHGRLYPPAGTGEAAMDGPLSQVVVTGIGHWRGEGLALVEAA
jgi:3-oxoacyl-[acyl-carrier-protein] synthase II